VLEAIFNNSVNGNLEWRKIEALLIAIGCQVIEGAGSSVTFEKRVNVNISIVHILIRLR